MTCTNKNAKTEIVGEARSLNKEMRAPAELIRQQKVAQLRATTGLNYSVSVEQALYQLEIINFNGKKAVVTAKSEPMPFFQFNEFMVDYHG